MTGLDLLLLVVGTAALIAAFVQKDFRAATGSMGGDKPIPRWVGATLFGLAGLVFILIAIRRLVGM